MILQESEANMELLRIEHLTKVYGSGENEVRALADISFNDQ